MSKRSTVTKPPFTKRVAVPKMYKDKQGRVLLLCPFCQPSHPLQPNVPAPCGTSLVLTAEQTVFHAKYDKRFVCVKCGKAGGEMVMSQNAFVHVDNCTPGVVMMTEPPKFSKWATFVNGIKIAPLRQYVEMITGRAMPVDEVLEDGTRTGKVLGHFFLKDNKNGKPKPVTT